MPTQLSKIAFIEEADLSKTKVFSVFQEGAEGASRQVLSIEANTAVLENNREIITSKVYTIDVVGLYSQADKSQVYTWASDRTELWVSGYGLDGSILQAKGTISVVDGYSDNASMRFRFQIESTGGYNATTGLHNSSMSYTKNALALYNWQEGNVTSDIPAGWTQLANGSPTFSFVQSTPLVGSITMTCDSSSACAIQRDVYFPFTGKTLYFSFFAGNITSTTNPLFSMTAFDSSDSSLSTDNEGITGQQLNQMSLTLPSGTAYVRLSVEASNDDVVIMLNPVLALNSDVGYNGNNFGA